jgi:hypothetical protein
MASRSHHWFDNEKLAPGERIVRTASARLRSDAPPYWWEGELVLTTERIFFLPFVISPLIDQVAFWLSEITHAGRLGRGRFRLAAGSVSASFELPGMQRARTWLDAIDACLGLEPRTGYDDGDRSQRAAG